MKPTLLSLMILATSAACVGAGPVLAADKTPDKTDGKSGGLAVEKIICNPSYAHSYTKADGKASPDYQAGVDSNGKSVAPADLNAAAPAAVPDYIEVPMTIDLAKKMGLSQVGLEGKLPVANLKLYKDGRVDYNGQDIRSNAATLCQGQKTSQNRSVGHKSPAMIEPAAGQDQMISAPSVTTNPDPRQAYHADSVAPQEFVPQAGSVAASSTGPEPKMEFKLQRGTANR